MAVATSVIEPNMSRASASGGSVALGQAAGACTVPDDEVVAMAVHDMKTPLTALRQALQVIGSGRAGAIGEAQARFVTMAMDNATVLGSLLDRLQGTLSGRSSADDVRPQRLDAWQAASFVVRALQPLAETRGVRLDLQGSAPKADSAADAWADPVLIRRLLLNLVTNALKYAGSGGVATVIVERAGEDDSMLTLRVRDRGPGIPETDHERIFSVRHRSESTCTGKQGAGLGLAIVRDIARVHGGRAWVANNPGAGCTFSVTLPVFGSGRGAEAQFQLLREASEASGSIELVMLQARPATAGRLADCLSGGLPGGWRMLDLAGGRIGIVRAWVDGAPPRATRDLLPLLGDEAGLVLRVGHAHAPACDVALEKLIATATASLRPMEWTAPCVLPPA